MGCRVGLPQSYLLTNLNQTFVKKEFQEWRTKVLLEEAKSKMADTQGMAQDYQEIVRINILNMSDKREVRRMMQQVRSMKTTIMARENQIARINSGQYSVADKDRKSFVMPCPDEGCKGYLSSGYTCGLCAKKTCPHCVVILNPDEPHECDPDMVATADLIKKETKPCPTCGERIGKVSGCDQMWCITCHTTFSWNKGAIEKGVIHNPHYYQWLREQSVDGEIPRAPGDVPAARGMQVTLRSLEILVRNEILSRKNMQIVSSSSRYAAHIREVLMRQNAPDAVNDTGTLVNATAEERDRIDYMLNRVSEKVLCNGLIRRDIRRKMKSDYTQIYTIYADSLTVTLDKIHAKGLSPYSPGRIEDGFVTNSLMPLIAELERIHHKYILELMSLSHIYNNRITPMTGMGWDRDAPGRVYTKELIAQFAEREMTVVA